MAFFDQRTFNPQGYGGQGGNLLEFLRTMQQQQQVQPSAGFGESALPQNAQPTQGVGQPMQIAPPPAAPAPASPGIGDRLLAGFQGFAGGGGLLPALSGAVSGLATGEAVPGANMTQQALIQRGFDPALAQQVARNPRLLQAVLPQLMGAGGQTDDIKEYQFAKREDPTLSFEKFIARKRSTTGEYGLNLFYGKDKNGKTVAFQPGKNGVPMQVQLPEGVELASGIERLDAGTHWVVKDRRTGETLGTEPKNVAGAASQKAQGTAQGEAKVGLPKVVDQANEALKIVDKALTHPGIDRSTGVMGTIWSAPGSPARDFDTIVAQIKGKSFLEAFQSLKGGGAISEVEGKKATEAIARLDQAQSKEAFLEALNELKGIINIGVQRAQKLAGVPASAAPAAPQSGVVDYRTYFGNK